MIKEGPPSLTWIRQGKRENRNITKRRITYGVCALPNVPPWHHGRLRLEARCPDYFLGGGGTLPGHGPGMAYSRGAEGGDFSSRNSRSRPMAKPGKDRPQRFAELRGQCDGGRPIRSSAMPREPTVICKNGAGRGAHGPARGEPAEEYSWPYFRHRPLLLGTGRMRMKKNGDLILVATKRVSLWALPFFIYYYCIYFSQRPAPRGVRGPAVSGMLGRNFASGSTVRERPGMKRGAAAPKNCGRARFTVFFLTRAELC